MEIKKMPRKYRIGNQGKEYDVVISYLGWSPEGFKDWYDWLWSEQERRMKLSLTDIISKKPPVELRILSPDKKQSTTLLMQHQIIKDAFHLDFFVEEMAKNWTNFYIASFPNTLEEFIVPMH